MLDHYLAVPLFPIPFNTMKNSADYPQDIAKMFIQFFLLQP